MVKQKKVNLTGAVASVSAKQLESRPITNIGQGLQGLIPNLNINMAGGKPGQGSTLISEEQLLLMAEIR